MAANQVRFWGKFLRGWGSSFEGIGIGMQGNMAYTETMGAHRTKAAFAGTSPSVSSGFVAPCASVVGDVTTAAGSSVWYGAVLRADTSSIKVGANSSIGERTVVGSQTVIGQNVNVGALAVLQACTVSDGACIGVGAQVLDGAKVGAGAIVDPASMVEAGAVVPAGEVWGGVPAAFVRKVSPDEAAAISRVTVDTAELAKVHATECSKSWAEVEADKESAYDKATRDPDYSPDFIGVYKV